ncbi:hypothetical protein TrLO_g5972 [Triparma laevis f. longispina]|uniref:Trafficking protein particle complex subunit 2 n=1 Tax=Triparma laevis f. longispina TaxID=1714387 RepID=A0A9W7KUV3_9STRA|nr:hypothetical protein TrLO_g5972 [Triparma laevis f. longispina]
MSSPPPPLLFLITSPTDPIYTAEFLKPGTTTSSSSKQYAHYLLHSQLDIVEKLKHSTSSSQLKTLSSHPPSHISGFLPPSPHAFLLLHGNMNGDNITKFFNDVCEVFLKAMMNPFQGMEDGINSKGFDDRVRAIARRYLS